MFILYAGRHMLAMLLYCLCRLLCRRIGFSCDKKGLLGVIQVTKNPGKTMQSFVAGNGQINSQQRYDSWLGSGILGFVRPYKGGQWPPLHITIFRLFRRHICCKILSPPSFSLRNFRKSYRCKNPARWRTCYKAHLLLNEYF